MCEYVNDCLKHDIRKTLDIIMTPLYNFLYKSNLTGSEKEITAERKRERKEGGLISVDCFKYPNLICRIRQ